MTHLPRIVYLHGFASSPRSSKAQFFRRKFTDQGIAIEIPQLDRGDFAGLTVTGQLQVVEQAVGRKPAVLMGSSLGGYVAALFAARSKYVEKLVLMAPAFQFPRRWRERYSAEELDRWKQQGSVKVFHYGHGTEMPLGYQFLEDSQQYEDEPDFDQPALIFHGLRDPVVPVRISQEYSARHANVSLKLLDSGHELTDVMDKLWEETGIFLLGRTFCGSAGKGL